MGGWPHLSKTEMYTPVELNLRNYSNDASLPTDYLYFYHLLRAYCIIMVGTPNRAPAPLGASATKALRYFMNEVPKAASAVRVVLDYEAPLDKRQAKMQQIFNAARLKQRIPNDINPFLLQALMEGTVLDQVLDSFYNHIGDTEQVASIKKVYIADLFDIAVASHLVPLEDLVYFSQHYLDLEVIRPNDRDQNHNGPTNTVKTADGLYIYTVAPITVSQLRSVFD